MGPLDIQCCGCLLQLQTYTPKKIAATILLHISIFHIDVWDTLRLLYFLATTKTGGVETQMGPFTIYICGCLLHVQKISSPKKLAAAILLQISIFHFDFWNTHQLIHYPAMTEIEGPNGSG